MEEKLKPCPFCGTKNSVITTYNLDCGNVYQVCCWTCGTRGPDYCNSKQEAIAAWNKRS